MEQNPSIVIPLTLAMPGMGASSASFAPNVSVLCLDSSLSSDKENDAPLPSSPNRSDVATGGDKDLSSPVKNFMLKLPTSESKVKKILSTATQASMQECLAAAPIDLIVTFEDRDATEAMMRNIIHRLPSSFGLTFANLFGRQCKLGKLQAR